MEAAMPLNKIQLQILSRFPTKQIKSGEQMRVTNEELVKILEDNGEGSKKFPAHAISRWQGWLPTFRATLAGASLVIRCQEDFLLPEIEDPIKIRIAVDKAEVEKMEATDPNFYYWPEEAKYLEIAIKARSNMYVAGHSGTGKTELFLRLFEKLELKAHRVNFDGEFSKSDFVGDWVLDATANSDGSKTTMMTYHDGILPLAMKAGEPLLLDEYDAAPPEILFTLQSVLEGKPLYNTRKQEEVVAKEGFMIAATANTVGKGDMSSLYAGTRLMNEANLNRFHYVIRMEYPKQEVERMIVIKRTGASKDLVQKIVEFMSAARKAAADGELYSAFGIRNSLNLANAIHRDKFPVKIAFRYTQLHRMSEEDQVKVTELAQRWWPEIAKA
jgi:cobaltochelatase CobS